MIMHKRLFKTEYMLAGMRKYYTRILEKKQKEKKNSKQ